MDPANPLLAFGLLNLLTGLALVMSPGVVADAWMPVYSPFGTRAQVMAVSNLKLWSIYYPAALASVGAMSLYLAVIGRRDRHSLMASMCGCSSIGMLLLLYDGWSFSTTLHRCYPLTLPVQLHWLCMICTHRNLERPRFFWP